MFSQFLPVPGKRLCCFGCCGPVYLLLPPDGFRKGLTSASCYFVDQPDTAWQFMWNMDGGVLFDPFIITNSPNGFENLSDRIRPVTDTLQNVTAGLEATGHYRCNPYSPYWKSLSTWFTIWRRMEKHNFPKPPDVRKISCSMSTLSDALFVMQFSRCWLVKSLKELFVNRCHFRLDF